MERLTFSGAILPEGSGSLSIAGSEIVDSRQTTVRGLSEQPIADTGLVTAQSRTRPGQHSKEIDASGFLILPGLVDLHGDAFERHLAPRRGALRSLGDGLRALEIELAANGITTAYLPQFWSWEGGMRGADFAEDLCAAVAEHDGALDLRVQLRLDIACHADLPRIGALIARYGIDYLVLNDRLPHAALSEGRRPPRLDGQALRAGRSPAEHHTLMHRLHETMPGAEAALATWLPTLDGVRIGSHDDATPAVRDRYRELGANIAEFPTTRETAQAARNAGDALVLGAPNVVRGGSHDRGVSAREMVAAGLCDALASDYHYPSLHHATLALESEGMSLTAAWTLVSEAPAAMLGMVDRGVIASGKRADLVIMEEATRRIVGTMAGGRFVHVAASLAERLLVA